MPFVKGGKRTWLLGNTMMANRIRNFLDNNPDRIVPTPEYCGPCCDTSQVDLHEAKAIVFNCMDFRLRDNVTCHLNLKGYKNEYDEVIAAGASLGYNGLLAYENWNTFVDNHVALAHSLHDISEIIIVEHEKCGAYKAQYGALTLEEEKKYHIENVKQAADTLWSKFNSTNGTIVPIPKLKIIAYLISINGGSFEKLYEL